MADAPYTPSIDEVKDCALSYSALMSEANFDRAIAAHVADEVERLAEEFLHKVWIDVLKPAGGIPGLTKNAMSVAGWLDAHAAELRKEQ